MIIHIVKRIDLYNCKIKSLITDWFFSSTFTYQSTFQHRQNILFFCNQLEFRRTSIHGNQRACDEDTSYVTHAIPSHGLLQTGGLRCVVSRSGEALGPPVPGSHSVSYIMHSPDAPSQSHLHFQPAALPQYNIGNCLSREFGTYIPSFAVTSYIKSCRQELEN